ncbi:MAG: phosphoribosylanthranilate isomerase [Phycisphaerae bacterium]|nr:phosphoribosylanthranilate isomerase [Phycisphaerae bacterium]
MTRIKVCGITTPRDARLAAEAGADAIGLVFARSPRRVSLEQAAAIVEDLPPHVLAVGVFVNEPAASVIRIAEALGLGEVQLHGDEPPQSVGELRRWRVVKSLRVRDAASLDPVMRYADAGAVAVLLDAFSDRAAGGTGLLFDWELLARARESGAVGHNVPLIVAGGLTPTNVAECIGILRPWGVDVSSGVEDAPGVKSADKIARFVAAVRGVDSGGSP